MRLLITSALSLLVYIKVQSEFIGDDSGAKAQQKDRVVSILIEGVPRCSGSFVGKHTVLTSSRCVYGLETKDIRVKFLDSTTHQTFNIFSVALLTTLNLSNWAMSHRISILSINDADVGTKVTKASEVMLIPQQNDVISESGSLTLFGWLESEYNGTLRMIFGSIELKTLPESLCLDKEREKNGKSEFYGGEICTHSSADNVPLSYLGGPVLFNGTQVAIASWYDEESSLIICKEIADSRKKIEEEMDIFESTFLMPFEDRMTPAITHATP